MLKSLTKSRFPVNFQLSILNNKISNMLDQTYDLKRSHWRVKSALSSCIWKQFALFAYSTSRNSQISRGQWKISFFGNFHGFPYHLVGSVRTDWVSRYRRQYEKTFEAVDSPVEALIYLTSNKLRINLIVSWLVESGKKE